MVSSILAKASEVPWGHCPCGWLVYLGKFGEATEHTCLGCGKSRPVVHDDDRRFTP